MPPPLPGQVQTVLGAIPPEAMGVTLPTSTSSSTSR